ncbi:MAG: DNA primase [Actinobacteria bacterium]|nr:DNA primase [Actinomycetota bacterium]
MAGRIRDTDVAHVRERTRIEDVIGEYIQLKSAGGGQRKGLCPFHDEKSPSFHVTPSRGFYHCFGCQESGDVITFLMKMEHLTFTETIERLAERMGYPLTYESGGGGAPSGERARLILVNQAAARFYQSCLDGEDAVTAREFLTSRGFDRGAAARFGVGYAPDQWDALRKTLVAEGFNDRELSLAGLTKDGQRGPIDRFRHRVIWPIRDISGEVVGFGARKLASDDVDSGPKYLNTPETPLYKKSQVLYGLDMAKKEIAKSRQAVIVEGYTDVMAAHLAGVGTAVATCGTAFGDDHIRILRRLLMDDDAFRGEVIFTFDGDAAGQKAALKAFDSDQKFVSQTFVAVEPRGMDPCELRQADGDVAVRDLIARRIPLFEFAIRSTLKEHNLDRPEGRVAALAASAPMLARIRDTALRPEYARSLARWIGVEVDQVNDAISNSLSSTRRKSTNQEVPAQPSVSWRPDPTEPALILEREVLKARLQLPAFCLDWRKLEPNAFTHPAYLRLRAFIDQGRDFEAVSLKPEDPPELHSFVAELSSEPIRSDVTVSEKYIASIFARLRELALGRTIAEIKSKLQRINPLDDEAQYNATFQELLELERERRTLRDLAVGEI